MPPRGRFADRTCQLCHQNLSSTKGEHVWPRWLLKRWEAAGVGPYTYEVGGNPLATGPAPGTPWKSPNLIRTKLPVCAVPCNKRLNERFEADQPTVEAFLDHQSLSVEEAEALGRWLLKTWLLLSHPQTHYEIPDQFGQEKYTPERWEDADDSLFAWIVAEPEIPAPPDLSIWAYREDPNGTVAGDAQVYIPLPTVTVDEVTSASRSRTITVEGINITLVTHPGWEIDHPLERDNTAIRLWPPTGAPVDIAGLPLVPANEVSFLRGPRLKFDSGTFPDANLPPLSENTDFSPGLGGVNFCSW